MTSKDALGHASARLQQVRARMVGAVLNRLDLTQNSYYYGYSYKRYYGEEGAREKLAASGRPRQKSPAP